MEEFKLKKWIISLLLICGLVLPQISRAQGTTDWVMWQLYKNQSLTIGSNYTAFWDSTFTIGPASNFLFPDIDSAIRTTKTLQFISIYSSEDVVIDFLGDDLNLRWASDDEKIHTHALLPAGSAIGWEVGQISGVGFQINNNSAVATTTIGLYLAGTNR